MWKFSAGMMVALFFLPGCSPKERVAEAFDPVGFEKKFHATAEKLRTDGKLVSLQTLAQSPISTKSWAWPKPGRERLTPEDIHDRLLASTVALGLYYLCPHCSRWHFDTGTGFALARGGILTTSSHVLEFDAEEMREAYPIAVDVTGRVYPVVEVLAFDPVADTCAVRVEGADFPPLPLSTGTRVGSALYCLSHPGQNYFMFTSGMLSRVETETRHKRPLRIIDVSCDYSPGSSGGAIVDSAGNVVAQVARIQPQNIPDKDGGVATVYNLRSSLASEEIQRLTDSTQRQPFPYPAKNPVKEGKP